MFTLTCNICVQKHGYQWSKGMQVESKLSFIEYQCVSGTKLSPFNSTTVLWHKEYYYSQLATRKLIPRENQWLAQGLIVKAWSKIQILVPTSPRPLMADGRNFKYHEPDKKNSFPFQVTICSSDRQDVICWCDFCQENIKGIFNHCEWAEVPLPIIDGASFRTRSQYTSLDSLPSLVSCHES